MHDTHTLPVRAPAARLRHRLLVLAAAFTPLLLAGCTGGDGGDGGGDPSPEDTGPIADGGPAPDVGPPTCDDVPGFVITAVDAPAPCIGRLPVVGERVLVADGRVRVAEVDLPLVGGDCETLQASGCALDAEAGDRRAIEATLDVAGGRLVLDGQRIEAYRLAECAPVALTLAPEPMGCLPTGLFEVAAPPTLTEGMCDLSWAAADVAVAVGPDDTGEVRWGANLTLDVAAVDREACTVTATSGLLLFNGVARTITLTAIFAGDRLDVQIEDALDGTSDFGEDCAGATFVGEGARVAPEGPALVAACEPLPFVCGDGTCAADAGEHCENCPDDCGCDGATCLRYALPDDPDDAPPRHACAEGCDDGICPADGRCVYPGEFDGFFVDGAFSQRVCLPASGDAPRGSACTDSRGCAADLVCDGGQCLQRCTDVDPASCNECRQRFDIPVELCLPRCDPEVVDQCGAGACASRTLNMTCSTVDREIWFCLPEAIGHGCVPGSAPGFGEPCGPEPDNTCAVGLACAREQCTRTEPSTFDCDVRRCSRPCETDDDCAAPLGACTSIEVPGSPARRWCTGPQ